MTARLTILSMLLAGRGQILAEQRDRVDGHTARRERRARALERPAARAEWDAAMAAVDQRDATAPAATADDWLVAVSQLVAIEALCTADVAPLLRGYVAQLVELVDVDRLGEHLGLLELATAMRVGPA